MIYLGRELRLSRILIFLLHPHKQKPQKMVNTLQHLECNWGNLVIISSYAPSIKVFETRQLSLKCMRGLDANPVRFCILSQDYKKVAIANSDRSIELHAQYGHHYSTRVPRAPTGMIYIPRTCDLVVSSCSNQLVRLSLEQGQFLQPININNEVLVNSLHYKYFFTTIIYIYI